MKGKSAWGPRLAVGPGGVLRVSGRRTGRRAACLCCPCRRERDVRAGRSVGETGDADGRREPGGCPRQALALVVATFPSRLFSFTESDFDQGGCAFPGRTPWFSLWFARRAVPAFRGPRGGRGGCPPSGWSRVRPASLCRGPRPLLPGGANARRLELGLCPQRLGRWRPSVRPSVRAGAAGRACLPPPAAAA